VVATQVLARAKLKRQEDRVELTPAGEGAFDAAARESPAGA
jgi:nitrogen fixation protein FixH